MEISRGTKGTISDQSIIGGVVMERVCIPEDVENYLQKGRRILKKVHPNDDFTLLLYFDNGEIRKYDLSNKLFGVFEVLQDIDKFKTVFIDEYGDIAWDKNPHIDSAKEWNNRIDICVDAAYLDSIPIETD